MSLVGVGPLLFLIDDGSRLVAAVRPMLNERQLPTPKVTVDAHRLQCRLLAIAGIRATPAMISDQPGTVLAWRAAVLWQL